ncbi:hypothetical protein SAMN05660659_04637 [Pseudomonas sp. LAMO17WK12:I6]|nr:hypothetical protein [Pseudomonas sp. LAMO17WK12:I6]SNY42541.1 hypothetical protein SAMN05660659_04637 [Pseudomonas sp. LAMO17WK12:I6]SNY43545.1 hypothetical protein SAMN05660455_04960 [Pseudomonas sp. LAMO17WK12:I5]
MDRYGIEDTDDWLGCPTPLETCRHQLALYENEFEELNLQLQQSRERIFKLVEMHAAASAECETIRSQLGVAKSEAADASRRATDIETKSNWELMAKDKHIAELRTQIRILGGDSPFKDPFPHQRETDRT